MLFREIKIKDLLLNPFIKFEKSWFILTAGDKDNFNAMTGSWGNMGFSWQYNIFSMIIGKDRYTREFIDEKKEFSVSFFNGHQKDLIFIGSYSGKENPDKIEQSNLTPIFIDGVPTFKEANLVFIVEVIYKDFIKSENFIDKDIVNATYYDGDYHMMYITKIKKVFMREY